MFSLKWHNLFNQRSTIPVGVSFPGHFLIQFFVCNEISAPRTFVLPLKSSSQGRWIRYIRIIAQWTICAGFLAILVWDVVDIADGGYMKTSYGKVNPTLSLISYCSTQIVFASSVCAVFFLASKKCEIIKSAAMIESLIITFDKNCSSVRNKFAAFQRPFKRLKLYFYSVAFLCCLVFIAPIIEPEFHRTLLQNYPYGGVLFPNWLFNVYIRGVFVLCTVIDYSVKSLFAYFNFFLCHCAEEFHNDQNHFFDLDSAKWPKFERPRVRGLLEKVTPWKCSNERCIQTATKDIQFQAAIWHDRKPGSVEQRYSLVIGVASGARHFGFELFCGKWWHFECNGVAATFGTLWDWRLVRLDNSAQIDSVVRGGKSLRESWIRLWSILSRKNCVLYTNKLTLCVTPTISSTASANYMFVWTDRVYAADDDYWGTVL